MAFVFIVPALDAVIQFYYCSELHTSFFFSYINFYFFIFCLLFCLQSSGLMHIYHCTTVEHVYKWYILYIYLYIMYEHCTRVMCSSFSTSVSFLLYSSAKLYWVLTARITQHHSETIEIHLFLPLNSDSVVPANWLYYMPSRRPSLYARASSVYVCVELGHPGQSDID